MSSIPHDMERTPEQSDDLDRGAHTPEQIHRWEFDALREDVKAIKFAVIGRHPMRPDPESLSMRVDEHEKAIKTARWLSGAAILGMLGMLGKMAWAAIVTGHKP